MKRYSSGAVILALLLGRGAGVAFSQGPTSTSAGPTSGFRAEYLKELSDIEKRIVSLAEMVPAEKYTWRPGEGVRSVSEVYLHMATVTFYYPRWVGTPEPAGFNPRGFDTSTSEKAKVVATLKDSFAHARRAILNLSDADADKQMKWIRGENTYRGFLLYMTRHLGEHLGQSIAYARINGIVPPWTEEQQRLQQQQKKQ